MSFSLRTQRDDSFQIEDILRLQAEFLTPEFSIHEFGYLQYGLPDWNFTQSFSPLWRFYYTMESGHHIEFDNQKMELGPEQIVIIPGGCLLNLRSNRRVPQFYFLFSPNPAYTFHEIVAPFSVRLDLALQHQLQQLIDLSRQVPRQASQRSLYHGLQAILHACFQRHPLEPHILPPELSRLLDLIHATPGGDLHNDVLAHRVGLSTSAFIRWFQSHLGVPPATYVRRARLDACCHLLTLTPLSIEEIAEQSGFANRHYFTRAFTRHTGSSPAAFRKQFQAMREL